MTELLREPVNLTPEDKWNLWCAICDHIASQIVDSPVRRRLENHDYVNFEKYHNSLSEERVQMKNLVGGLTTEFGAVDYCFSHIIPELYVTIDHYGQRHTVKIDFKKIHKPIRLVRQQGCDHTDVQEFYWEEGGWGSDSGNPHRYHMCRHCFKDVTPSVKNFLRKFVRKWL